MEKWLDESVSWRFQKWNVGHDPIFKSPTPSLPVPVCNNVAPGASYLWQKWIPASGRGSKRSVTATIIVRTHHTRWPLPQWVKEFLPNFKNLIVQLDTHFGNHLESVGWFKAHKTNQVANSGYTIMFTFSPELVELVPPSWTNFTSLGSLSKHSEHLLLGQALICIPGSCTDPPQLVMTIYNHTSYRYEPC